MHDSRLPGSVGADRDDRAALEICSYRQVFAFERRLYRIEGLRLNPAGVPLRAISCFLAFACAGLLLGRLPLVGGAVGIVPWYLREAAVPALGAFLLTTVRLEGRPLHAAAISLIRWQLGPRELVGLRAQPRFRRRRRGRHAVRLGRPLR